jgi:hypothetical protein
MSRGYYVPLLKAFHVLFLQENITQATTVYTRILISWLLPRYSTGIWLKSQEDGYNVVCSHDHCCHVDAKILPLFIVFGVHVAVNNKKLSSVATEVKKMCCLHCCRAKNLFVFLLTIISIKHC